MNLRVLLLAALKKHVARAGLAPPQGAHLFRL